MRKRVIATIFVAALIAAVTAQAQHVKTMKGGTSNSAKMQ